MSHSPLGFELVDGHGRQRLLDDLQRVVVEQLGRLPSELFQPIEARLQEEIRNGAGLHARTDLIDLPALRARSAGYEMRFRELLARNFDVMRSRLARDARTDALGLVEESDLGVHLAGQQLAEALSSRHSRLLELLDRRFEALSVGLGAPHAANPVTPQRLAGAFLQAFAGAGISDTLWQCLFEEYEKALNQRLDDVYGKLNTMLAQQGLLSSRHERTQVQKPAAGVEIFRAPAESRIELQRLRELLHAWRGTGGVAGAGGGAVQALAQGNAANAGAGHGGNGGNGGGTGGDGGTGGGTGHAALREFQHGELGRIAVTVQCEQAPAFVESLRGIGQLADAIRASLSTAARGFGFDPKATRFSQREQDAIDLVAMVFTSLAHTHVRNENGRQLLARLVVAYVRVAFEDELLFLQADHPARRLLDAVTLSCEGNDGATPQDQALLQRAGEVVSRVTAEYNEDLAIFTLAARELEDLLQQQSSRAEAAERRAAEAVHGRERLHQARGQAAEELVGAIHGQSLTQEIGGFLAESWLHHAVQVLLRDGQRSERHEQLVELARALVALDAAAGRAAGAEVADGLVNLESILTQCAQSSGLHPQVAQEWLASFARGLAFPDAKRDHAEVAVPVDDTTDENPSLRLVGGTDTLDFDEAKASAIRELGRGAWLRLVDDAGNEVPVKLAWISPITDRRLLVDRRGMRRLVASTEQLAVLAGEGRLLLSPAGAPFDTALRSVRRTLEAAA